MHAKGDVMASGSVPAFLTKLWNLVENPVYDYLIAWDVSGNSFHVFDQGRFAKEILPMYFKHSNMASFIRQLNMYGFRKVVHIEQGLKTETDDVEFQHPYFQKGQEQLLELIKRKISGHTPNVKVEPTGVKVKQEDVTKVLNDVRAMKGKQDIMNSKLESMKRENEVLWREIASLRQKHIKQQQIVNKLIQFLVHLVGGNRGLKRSLPLMISDANSSESTVAKIPKYEPSSAYSVQSPPDLSFLKEQTLSGPTIHEVTDSLPAVANTVDIESEDMGSTVEDLALPDFVTGHIQNSSESADSHQSQLNTPDFLTSPTSLRKLSDPLLTPSMSNIVDVPANILQASASSSALSDSLPSNRQSFKSLSRQSSVSEMSDHLESLHYDLEGLKDVLSSNQYFDPRTLLGLFNNEDQKNKESSLDTLLKETEDTKTHENDFLDSSTGSELVQYKTGEDVLPALFDLADLTNYESDTEHFTGDDSATISTDVKTPVNPSVHVSADDLD